MISLPPALIVIAPKETIVEDAPPFALIANAFAVIAPVVEIAVDVAADEDCVALKVTTPPLITPVSLTPAPVVVVVVILIDWLVAVIEPVLE